jgi:hypothetical protein
VVATDDTIMPMLSKGKAANARMWIYVGDENHAYNVFDFTLNRGRDGPKHFLKDYREVLLADAYGGYNGVVAGNEITRAGCWAHFRRKVVEAEKAAPELARAAVEMVRALYAVERQAAGLTSAERLKRRQDNSVPVVTVLREKLLVWKEQLLPKHPMAEAINYALTPMGGTDGVLRRRSGADGQQHQRARNEASGAEPQELALCGQCARRKDGGDLGEPDEYLPPPRRGPATVPDATANEPAVGAHHRPGRVAAG